MGPGGSQNFSYSSPKLTPAEESKISGIWRKLFGDFENLAHFGVGFGEFRPFLFANFPNYGVLGAKCSDFGGIFWKSRDFRAGLGFGRLKHFY